MEKTFIRDDSQFNTVNLTELQTFLKEREENSQWYTDEEGTKANIIRCRPVFDEPICVPANVSKLKASKVQKFTASEEAYADTMNAPDYGYNGSTQLMLINNRDLVPVGNSAIKGLIGRAGLEQAGWEKMKKGNPQDLSEVINNLFKHTKGHLSILVQDEKVRAVNGGKYAICPMTFVAEETANWMATNYPKAKFISGHVNHYYSRWTVDLSEYSNDIFANFPDLKAAGFEPVLIVQTSNIGASSVSLKPGFKLQQYIFPLSTAIDCTHKVAGKTATERTENIKSIVKENFTQVFPIIEKNLKEVDKLRNIPVQYGYNAVLRGMKEVLHVPKLQGLEAAEQFKFLNGEGSCSAYDCYMAVVDAYAFIVRDYPKDTHKQFEAAEMVARAIKNVDWAEKGKYPGDYSW